jgi:hypothetical protein
MKARQKKTRETRAAYRVKTRQAKTQKPRLRKARAKQTEEILVPWGQRIAPTDQQVKEWDKWLSEQEPEFEKKYPGHYLAIWDKQIIALTRESDQIYPLARKAMPKVIPLIWYVPRPEEMWTAPGNFPVEWVER